MTVYDYNIQLLKQSVNCIARIERVGFGQLKENSPPCFLFGGGGGMDHSINFVPTLNISSRFLISRIFSRIKDSLLQDDMIYYRVPTFVS